MIRIFDHPFILFLAFLFAQWPAAYRPVRPGTNLIKAALLLTAEAAQRRG
jgi:hypothetical protein